MTQASAPIITATDPGNFEWEKVRLDSPGFHGPKFFWINVGAAKDKFKRNFESAEEVLIHQLLNADMQKVVYTKYDDLETLYTKRDGYYESVD